MFNKYYQKRRTALTLAIIMVLALFAPVAEHTALAESTYGSSAYGHIEYLSENSECVTFGGFWWEGCSKV